MHARTHAHAQTSNGNKQYRKINTKRTHHTIPHNTTQDTRKKTVNIVSGNNRVKCRIECDMNTTFIVQKILNVR